MLGSVRPIQNGRWNCVQLSKANIIPVNRPNRRPTARRIKQRPAALALARTMRTAEAYEPVESKAVKAEVTHQ